MSDFSFPKSWPHVSSNTLISQKEDTAKATSQPEVPESSCQLSHCMQYLSLAWLGLRQAGSWYQEGEGLLPLQILKSAFHELANNTQCRRNHLPLVRVGEKSSALTVMWTLKIHVWYSCQKIQRATAAYQGCIYFVVSSSSSSSSSSSPPPPPLPPCSPPAALLSLFPLLFLSLLFFYFLSHLFFFPP